jgi:hypothetical protein
VATEGPICKIIACRRVVDHSGEKLSWVCYHRAEIIASVQQSFKMSSSSKMAANMLRL